MLATNMRERSSGQILLKDVKLMTGRDLLFYLYNRRLREDADLEGLLGLAEQYDLQAQQCCGSGLFGSDLTKLIFLLDVHLDGWLVGSVFNF
jgi:hypothetical protein